MKARLFMASLMALAGTHAAAQTSVTLYGRMDVALQYLNRSGEGTPDSGSAFNMASDTNYWGLRGSEQLNDGHRAYFRIESGFQPTSGNGAGALFDRESYIGWGSHLGNVQVGGQFAPAVTLTGRLDPFQRSMNGLIQNLMQVNAGNANRGTLSHRDNAVQYISPTLNGFTVRALYNFTNSWQGEFNVSRSRALGLEYSSGNLYTALSWEGSQLARNDNTGTLEARSQNNMFFGATYDFGGFKLHGMVMQNRLEGEANAMGYMAGASGEVNGGTVRMSITTRSMHNDSGSRASVYALGYTYPLSKRTMLYSSVAYLHNGSEARYNLWPNSRSIALSAPGQSVTGFQVGMRHMF